MGSALSMDPSSKAKGASVPGVGVQDVGSGKVGGIRLMIYILRCLKDLRTLNYGHYCIFLIMGNTAFISSTVAFAMEFGLLLGPLSSLRVGLSMKT